MNTYLVKGEAKKTLIKLEWTMIVTANDAFDAWNMAQKIFAKDEDLPIRKVKITHVSFIEKCKK